MEPKQKQYPAVDVTGDRSKVRCYKEQYCIGTWNVRPMNQGKFEVIKQEMARVNIDILGLNVDILGISKLKRTGMSEFNSDDHYSNYCGKNPLEKWTRHHSQQKNQKCSILMRSQNDLCLFPREAIQYQSNPSLCPNQ